MYCRYCGDRIPDDSLFCPICGKSLAHAHTTPVSADTDSTCSTRKAADGRANYRIIAENVPIEMSSNREKPSLYDVGADTPAQMKKKEKCSPTLAIVLSSIALAIFIPFFIFAAPGHNITRIVVCSIGILIAAALYVVALVFLLRSRSVKLSRILVCICSLLIVPCIVLSGTYLVKLDHLKSQAFYKDYTGIKLEIDYEYFSYVGQESVKSTYAYLEIGSQTYSDGDVLYILPNFKYSGVIFCGHSQNEGCEAFDFNLTSFDIKQGRKEVVTVKLGSTQYAEVTLTFSLATDFWSIIFS